MSSDALKKQVSAVALFDVYHDFLTETQRRFYEDHYVYDLSLSEIALNENVSRSAVSEAITAAEKKMQDMEEKLKILAKRDSIRAFAATLDEAKQKELEELVDAL